MTDAPCIIVTEDDINAELAMIDENLCRTDMTLAERIRIMARRKELYEEKHPETKHGAIGNGRSRVETDSTLHPQRFAAATAAAIGKVERVVHLDVSRGTKIGEEALALVTRTPLDNARYLDTLKRVSKAEQVERVRRDLAECRADPPGPRADRRRHLPHDPHAARARPRDRSTAMSTAENLPAVQSVEFNGDRLATFEQDGERWVAMRPIAEAMGLNWAGQQQKLIASPERFNCIDIHTVGSDGRQRQMLCIPLRRYPMWLATINPAKSPDLAVGPDCGNGSMGG